MRRPTATDALLGLAVSLTGAAVALEAWHAYRRGQAPRETVEAAVAGYQASSERENALLNLLVAYAATAGVARASTHSIRSRGALGPFRNRRLAGRHIHHFLPGIALAFVSGGAAIVSRNEAHDRWLAIPFGVGAALTLDEAALLVELEDVYWSKEGVLSVQVSMATLSLLGALALGFRTLRRGEAEVGIGSGP
ncbi:MAG: hypothetical protein QOE86_3123 [Solirubrobacteraceae bacterium]|jgi:hypothetical protein|nr:hypothetical protein [Solirubrobacteraceae bacterium]